MKWRHITRGDWIAHLAAEFACRIFWFNPLFWMARTRMSRESERAADDIVIGLGACGTDYASHLIAIVRAAQTDDGFAATVAIARRSGLEHRIAALVNGLANRARLSRAGAAAILASACIVAAPLAALGARVRSTIEIQTSNLPPIDALDVRVAAGDDSEPVREIRPTRADSQETSRRQSPSTRRRHSTQTRLASVASRVSCSSAPTSTRAAV